ncbi:dephospho-CoA kinase [Sneathiella glossodoripedis]|uniref:dephospho-CoA kinase n=1 Tax=Sneathiella glossodoripedis TaxID=418853 RepID=UPI000AB0E2B9|nr:dephospho-CoA kinase [Sneathiella glossodoripedis]
MIKIIGLTGSIGMGKSTVGVMFREEGIPVYNADAEVHKFYQVGGQAVEPISKLFPEAVIDGRVDRPTLSKLVLGDDSAIKKLEAIVHPMVGAHRAEFLQKAEQDGHDMVILDVPLIFETGGEKNFHKIVVVSAPAQMQRDRVLVRDDMSAEKFESILARQVPDAQKRELADYVIDTGLPMEETRKQVQDLIRELREEAAHA